MLEYLFWTLLFIVFYTYLGYGVILVALVKLKDVFFGKTKIVLPTEEELPSVTFFVAAFNEADLIEEKIKNTFSVDYPADKLQFIIVTDGSTDATPEIVAKYDKIDLYHEDKRGGKIGAINRGMEFAKNEIMIFSDANAMLNKEAFRNIVKHYTDPKVGCVAGEKRVFTPDVAEASSAGEGLYWKYESLLKRFDYKLYTAVGAAGELFSIRKALYKHVEIDTILDDFVLSLRCVQEGYKIAYEPNAFALEASSASILDEMKRKVRISAGGVQGVVRLRQLLNIFKYHIISFQYISHRVLRWTITPLSLFLLPFLNFLLYFLSDSYVYFILFSLQVIFYTLGLFGYIFEKRKMKVKIFFVPFYFLFMNFCVLLGIVRYLRGSQSSSWEKAQRSDDVVVLR